MYKRISVLKARGAVILGHGEVLLASLTMVLIAFIVVALIYME